MHRQIIAILSLLIFLLLGSTLRDVFLNNLGNLSSAESLICLRENCSVDEYQVLAKRAIRYYSQNNNNGHPENLLMEILLNGQNFTGLQRYVLEKYDLALLVKRFLVTAQALKTREEYETAQQILLAAVSIDNRQSAKPHYDLGEMYFKQERYPEAIIAFNDASGINSVSRDLPKWEEGVMHFYWAEAHRLNNDLDQAYEHYQKVTEHFPEKGWPLYAAYIYMASIAQNRGDFDQAYQLLLNALKYTNTDEELSIVYKSLGSFYIHIEDYQQALKFSLMAIEKNQTDPYTYLLTGQIYELLNEKEKALDSYLQSKRVDPGFKDADPALQRLMSDQ